MAETHRLNSLYLWPQIISPPPPYLHEELCQLATAIDKIFTTTEGLNLNDVAEAISATLNKTGYANSTDAAIGAVTAASSYMNSNYGIWLPAGGAYRDMGSDRHEGRAPMAKSPDKDPYVWEIPLAKTYEVTPLMVVVVEPIP